MNKALQVLLFLLLVSSPMFGQDSSKVKIIISSAIEESINKKTELNKKNDGKVPGYRVKIHFSSDRTKAEEIKTKFQETHADVAVYQNWESPNFTITVGDFRSKLEAFKFLKEIKGEYPAAFIVKSDVYPAKQTEKKQEAEVAPNAPASTTPAEKEKKQE
jgi:hypothetical protein